VAKNVQVFLRNTDSKNRRVVGVARNMSHPSKSISIDNQLKKLGSRPSKKQNCDFCALGML
jgi:hypothetical protein